MRKFLRLIAGLSCLGVLILGAVFLCSTGSHLPSDAGKKKLLEELQRDEQLIQGRETFQRYKRAKLQVAEEVIAGRLSLAEALEAFRRLAGQHFSNITKQHVLKERRMSEDEWLGSGLLDYVKDVLVDHPDESTAVVSRVQKELGELLADRKKRPAAPPEPRTERRR
jgi:hypothetical protein